MCLLTVLMRGRRHCCCCRCDSDDEDEVCVEHGPPKLPWGCRQCLVNSFIEEAKRVGTVTEENGSHTIEIPLRDDFNQSDTVVRVTHKDSDLLGVMLGEYNCFYEVEIDADNDVITFGQASWPGHKEWLVWRGHRFVLEGRTNYTEWDFGHRSMCARYRVPEKTE